MQLDKLLVHTTRTPCSCVCVCVAGTWRWNCRKQIYTPIDISVWHRRCGTFLFDKSVRPQKIRFDSRSPNKQNGRTRTGSEAAMSGFACNMHIQFENSFSQPRTDCRRSRRAECNTSIGCVRLHSIVCMCVCVYVCSVCEKNTKRHWNGKQLRNSFCSPLFSPNVICVTQTNHAHE